MLISLANAIELSFDIPEAEKVVAQEAEERFLLVVDKLLLAEQHLDIMYNPFKKYDQVSAKSLQENVGVLNRFKQQVKENFNIVLKASWMAMEKFSTFDNDTEIASMIKSFKDQIGTLEHDVNTFLETFNNLDSADFKTDIVNGLDQVKKEIEDLRNLIEDRIIEYLDTNILVKNWLSNTSKLLNKEIQPDDPLVSKLFKERKESLEGNGTAQVSKRETTLSPAMTESVMIPQDIRDNGKF